MKSKHLCGRGRTSLWQKSDAQGPCIYRAQSQSYLVQCAVYWVMLTQLECKSLQNCEANAAMNYSESEVLNIPVSLR